ncbi:uncharacterized protein EAF01_000954 [Botrytis porri]|uniref:Uncharacterized protein n=1 Tax=Botrytis porri TaxID=87229 RepID=A0A4Z1KY65_9HELO|nr:uncharacterized protein EAF01_000954 [Botrytis porri]KAF7914548.1 hypothetical protein EAF01_000954 [Botrytis porri]TGO89360.1 hypothetical protein BPOR_0113g00130 [Botrytis porri]
MHFLIQTLIAAAFLAGAVFSVPQGIPPNGSGGGDQSSCHWNCCEYDPSTHGTLCRNNTEPYPYGVDCYPALYAANMTCCHQTDCQDQTYFDTPIVVI